MVLNMAGTELPIVSTQKLRQTLKETNKNWINYFAVPKEERERHSNVHYLRR